MFFLLDLVVKSVLARVEGVLELVEFFNEWFLRQKTKIIISRKYPIRFGDLYMRMDTPEQGPQNLFYAAVSKIEGYKNLDFLPEK